MKYWLHPLLLLFCSILQLHATQTYSLSGSALTLHQPVESPPYDSWYAELVPSTFARFAEGTDRGVGKGTIIIRFSQNPSTTESRFVDFYINGRLRMTLEQLPFDPANQPHNPYPWWEASDSNGNYDTALFAEGEPGMGWVYDEAWPYIYSYALNTWLYIDPYSPAESFYAFRFDGNRWLWGTLQWGWYYDYSTGWAAF